MNSNIKHQSSKILRQLMHSSNLHLQQQQLNTQHKYIEIMICQMASQILNFNKCEQGLEKIAHAIILANIDRQTFKNIWNTALQKQIKKFAIKVQNIIQVSKQSQNVKIIQSSMEKLKLLINSIQHIVNIIAFQQKWCLCSRAICTNRFDIKFTTQSINRFFVSYIHADTKSKKCTGDTQFFNMSHDEVCNLISLQILDQKQTNLQEGKAQNNKQQSKQMQQLKGSKQHTKQSNKSQLQKDMFQQTIDFLMNLKIDHQNRKDCFYGKQWLQKMKIAASQYHNI